MTDATSDTSGADTEPFTDAHVHFWDHAQPDLRWRFLEPDFDHPRLKGTQRLDAPRYTPVELATEAGTQPPARLIHIQCSAPTRDPRAETTWLERLSAETGAPHALVVGCRLLERDAADVVRANADSPLYRGVRDLTVTGAVTPDEVAPALDAVAETGGAVELMLPPEHYGSLAELALRWPETTFVLGHAGQPLERSREYHRRWTEALRSLAASAPNVVVKVSAIASSGDPDWTTESIRPWVLGAIGAFGPQRAMLATNWPIDRLYGTYERLVQSYREIVESLDPADRCAVLHGTADRVF